MAFQFKNISGGMVPFALDHRNFCGTGPCSCSTSKGAKLNYKGGLVVAANIQPLRHARVVTLLKGETSETLPNAVMQCDEVKALLNAKPPKLKAIEVPDPPPKPVKAKPSAEEAPAEEPAPAVEPAPEAVPASPVLEATTRNPKHRIRSEG